VFKTITGLTPKDYATAHRAKRVRSELGRSGTVTSTASYTDIVNRIGLPKSVRAIAQACSANALAVAIPCHRVVRNDGALPDYRRGIERKRALLEREIRT
jgi:O-6-methylguanine DNA methyltransferase